MCLFSKTSDPALDFTRPNINWIPEATFPVIKRPGREVSHETLSRADI